MVCGGSEGLSEMLGGAGKCDIEMLDSDCESELMEICGVSAPVLSSEVKVKLGTLLMILLVGISCIASPWKAVARRGSGFTGSESSKTCIHGIVASCGLDDGGGESLRTLGRSSEDLFTGSCANMPVFNRKARGEGLSGSWTAPPWLRFVCGGAQSGLKLTIGRPGLSLTADGEGSFALRSLNFMLVAARSSSERTSIPFLYLGSISDRSPVLSRLPSMLASTTAVEE